ncbi:hypothetical protein PILCRDRAFT_238674 [Piloderma croceum F 1598]|uniref:Uncharacterized protein n=1 Tax=Piloderma croceum (strain F 1598) TaxID=765440 RepID=A0A0C3BQJ2_PILCF|nr:hypothetical protein PILCRDRAFT_238674 [Piloderma croceum F 1598]
MLICPAHATLLPDLPTTVTFMSYDARLDLPNPRSIKVHVACARVAHVGNGKIIDKLWEDGCGDITIDQISCEFERANFAAMHSTIHSPLSHRTSPEHVARRIKTRESHFTDSYIVDQYVLIFMSDMRMNRTWPEQEWSRS